MIPELEYGPLTAEVANQCGVRALPFTFLIDRIGHTAAASLLTARVVRARGGGCLGAPS